MVPAAAFEELDGPARTGFLRQPEQRFHHIEALQLIANH